MKNFTIFSLIIAYFLSTSTSDAINTSVNSDIIKTDSVIVADTLSISTDSLVITPLSAAVDSLNVATVDTLSMDSLSSLADSISVVADTLLTDSLSMVADSIKTISDSISAVKDSIAVAPKPIIKALATPELYDKTLKTPLSVYKKIPERDRALLISYYKNLIKDDQTGDAYVKAYTPWREAFMATPGREKTLDMYIDGVGIIIGNIDTDTLYNKVDRIHPLTEDLMELYNLAVRNVDVLNGQIDFTKTKDSITVAKLRAQQVRHYRNFFEIDSMFHSTHHTNYNDAADIQYWENFMFKDSASMSILYPWYLEIITSPDTDIDITHVAHFVKLLDFKFVKDNAVSLEFAKENFLRDRALAEEKANVLLENADPFVIVDNKTGLTQKDYYASQFRGIENTLNSTASRVIAIDDYDSYEKLYTERLSKEGPKMWPEILNSPLSKYPSSELYWNALVHKYKSDEQAEFITDAGPSYELAQQIAELSLRQGKYKESLDYTNYAMEFPEFEAESDFKKAQTYMIIVQTYDKVGGNTKKRMDYIKKAMATCPDYPEPYYYEASAIFSTNLGKKASQQAQFGKYWVAYDRYELAKSKLKALDTATTDIKTRLTLEIINSAQAACRSRFPDSMEFFQLGWQEGTPYTLPLFGGYTTTMRSSK